jgi:hypothetical protein
MLGALKALVVVLGIALVAFWVAKRFVVGRFMSEELFVRRRNVWLITTLAAFLAPNFWVYVLVAAPVMIWLGRKDPNPLAVYLLLLFVIPPWGFEIPAVGINKLFDLNQARLLALVVLIPAASRAAAAKGNGSDLKLTAADYLLLAFGLLQLALFVPYESPTNTVRRGFLFLLDIYLPFLVARQACRDRAQVVDAMATFFVACALLAPIGAFEVVKTWTLYAQLGDTWGYTDLSSYLLRGGILRAQASSGHALTLGYLMAMGFGFWLYLRSRATRTVSLMGVAWMWLGLLAAYSRGPWVTAVALYFLLLFQHPVGKGVFFKGLFIAAAVAVAVLVSPLGSRVIDNLPFVGTVDVQNVVYREQLAATSWLLIKKNPFFGDPFVLLQMESLRQGEGIIDLVNAYATVALFYGLVGLSLYVGVFAVSIWKANRALLACRRSDPDLSLLGADLVACMLATLFFMATAGFAALQYVLAGMLVGYAAVATAPIQVRNPTAMRRGVARPA